MTSFFFFFFDLWPIWSSMEAGLDACSVILAFSLIGSFNKLLRERQPWQNPKKVIFNFNISLSDAGKFLLVKDLKFSNTPKKLNDADYLVNFELFYSIFNLGTMSNEN